MKKSVKIWIILGIIAVLIIAAVLYFFVFSKGSGFNIPNIDYSAGASVGDNLEKATDVNVFDKLNPFR
jgi:flagellar basal body-associated protein FliL